jgi:serine/threonine protein kinase/tetratricopeptide (TPR) repeat protein
VIADRFEIEALAGEGGMGAVFRARDLKKNQIVALKAFSHRNKAEEDSFFREAQLLSELEHPSIVQYISHGRTSKGFAYLVMEWLEGEDLSEKLRRGGLSLFDTMQIIRQTAEVLQVIHEGGIIHRDIKPPNLFLLQGRCDQLKLIDFGIAKIHQNTQTNALIGTLGYMAPEQARGETTLDARADIFSLGCVFFECLVGHPPFMGSHEVAVLAKILLEEAPRLRDLRPGIPAVLDALVARMLSKDPRHRPESAAQLTRELPSNSELVSPAQHPPTEIARALTQKEQRLLCIVLLAPESKTSVSDDMFSETLPGSEDPSLTTPQTSTLADEFYRLEEARDLVEQHGGRFEQLADGSRVAALWGEGAAADQASRGARCALSLKRLFPRVPFALSMGRHVADTRLPLGEVIDRAAQLLQKTHSPTQIIIDELAAGLLEGSFVLEHSSAGAMLRQELSASGARTLFGKITPFVGREAELSTLLRSQGESVKSRRASATLLLGPLGAGKSRLAYELRNKSKVLYPQALLWSAKGDLVSGGAPYRLLRQLFVYASGLSLDKSSPSTLHAWESWLSREGVLSPEALAFLGELLGLTFEAPESLPLQAARQDPLLMTEQVKQTFLRWISQRCQKRPLFLLLDDLHWADAPSLSLLEAAAQKLVDRPLWIIGMARPEIKESAVWSSGVIRESVLSPLSREACVTLVQRSTPQPLSSEQLEQIVTQAEGNAFYLEELLRAAISGQGALPQTLLAVLQARIEQLPEEPRRLLRAGSILGLSFSQGAIEALLSDSNPDMLRGHLSRLCEQEILYKTKEAHFSFRHSLLREASYQMLTEPDRVLGHKLAAHWMLEQPERDVFSLAQHFWQGKDIERALDWYQRAAEQALDAGDLERVISIFSHAKIIGVQGEQRGVFLTLAAEAYNWRASFQEAQDTAQEAFAILPPGQEHWFQAAAELVLASGRLSNQESLVATAKRLLSYDAKHPRCMLAMTRAVPRLLQSGELSLGEDLLHRLAAAAKHLSSRDFAFAWVPVAEASAAMLRGDLGAFLSGMKEAVRRFQARGDRRNACMQQLDVGYAHYFAGDYERAVSELQEVAKEANQLGLYRITTAIQRALATSLLYTHQEQEGIELLRKTLQQNPDERTRLHLVMGLLFVDDVPGAQAELDLLLSKLAPDSAFASQSHACQAEIFWRQDNPAQALLSATHAMKLRKGLAVEVGDAVVRLQYARALFANDRVEEAIQVLQEANQQIITRANQISDPNLRQTFLHNIPEHVAVSSLLAQWAS